MLLGQWKCVIKKRLSGGCGTRGWWLAWRGPLPLAPCHGGQCCQCEGSSIKTYLWAKWKLSQKHNFSSAELFYNSTLSQVKTLGVKGKENIAMTLVSCIVDTSYLHVVGWRWRYPIFQSAGMHPEQLVAVPPLPLYIQGESKKSGISKTMARTPLKSIRKGKS